MRGSCHPHRRSARPGLVLVSVLALLAFACFPAISVAEGTIYDPEPTTIPNTPKPKPDKPTNNGKGGSSDEEAEKSNDTPVSGGVDDEEGGSTGGSSPDTGEGGGTGQSNQGDGSKGNADISSAQPVQEAPQTEATPVSNQTSSDDGGSSSPLVPILIALAALAAVSIGVVVLRNRRSGSDGPVAPKAS